ncbi:hypothetical protein [Pseudarthrobacter sp. LT1]|uniref:hypothetical protein n=1 Tax=Pseudarthrobacter sp. LT1 TaxID=3111450 RepID=UPI002D784DE6|nr:hypothetical protein [Pseudarthrobacter sp. LT1]WRT14472.1 hypothetical protein VIK36_02975 [Pseudarthrobacter sp. LT1]
MTPAPENRVALVDDMLLNAGCHLDADLRNALLSLGTLASLPAPAPSGELAALLTAGGPSPLEGPAPAGEPAGEPGEEAAEQAAEQPGGQPDAHPGDELARRRRHRPTALGLVLVAGMGLGVGGVAASSSPSGNSPVEHLLEDWAPWNGTAGEPSAAGYSYRGPRVASDGDLAAAGSPAPGAATDAANLTSSLLRDPAGSSRHTGRAHPGFPPCVGPVKHEAGAGAEACTPAAPGTFLQGNGTGRGKENPGAATDGMPAEPRAAEAAKAGLPAVNTGTSAGAAAAEAQKAAGSAANTTPAQGQTGSQAAGQGTGPKPTSPAK